MPRRSLLISSVVTVAALAPATPALAASPGITAVSPMHVSIGQKLTLRGHDFRAGSGRNIVAFKRSGGRVVFVRSGRSTHRLMTVTVSSKLRSSLNTSGTTRIPTRFSLNVLGQRLGSHWTPQRLSPVISNGSGTATGPAPVPNCGTAPGDDPDHDLLPNWLERQIHTNPCVSDTDGDGVPDGYEYQSALELNDLNAANSLPYPGKRPYPNPLDAADANADHDGDGLTLADEYHAWMKFGNTSTLQGLLYSDGTQHSPYHLNDSLRTPAPTGSMAYLDYNHDGVLTDDEKDVDGDGLSNWVEAHGPLQPAWWPTPGAFSNELPLYSARTFDGLNWLDRDTDGDGVPDGADDVDHDGYTNVQEFTRLASKSQDGRALWVQPFNPCLPNPDSTACSLHIPLAFAQPWAPFTWGPERTLIAPAHLPGQPLSWPPAP